MSPTMKSMTRNFQQRSQIAEVSDNCGSLSRPFGALTVASVFTVDESTLRVDE